MNSVTVDELVMRIEVELDKFRAQAGQAEAIDAKLRKSLKDTEKTARETGEGFDDLGDNIANVNKALESKLKILATASRRLAGFFAVITGSNALQRLANGVANANDQLQFLSRRLGMAARDVRALDTAIAALGGTNASAINTIQSLNQGIQEMVIMGNDALIPFFGALGVGVTDAAGNVREMDDILLDMADSLSRMDPQRAYALATAMGLDDGVANALLQGRDAMKEMLEMHEALYVSTQAELEASRELRRAQTFLGRQWESLKTLLADAIIPHLIKMTEMVSGWIDFLLRNERTVKNVFEGMAIALGVVLIPMLTKAALAMIAFLSPVLATAAAVTALAIAFVLLYDDYKTWAEGGKSFFNWEEFAKFIENTEFSVSGLSNAFIRLTTGYNTFSEAWRAGIDWLKSKGVIDLTAESIKNLWKALRGEGWFDTDKLLEPIQNTLESLRLLSQGKFKEAAQMAGLEFRTDEGSIGGFFQSALENRREQAARWSHDGLMPPTELLPEFEMAAAKHNVPVSALIAIAHQESRFNPNAYNKETKAAGMFQYIPATAKALGIDPWDALQSMDAAAMQLRQRLDLGETLEEAIRHHHGGPNRSIWGSNNDAYANDVMGKISAIEARGLSQGFISSGGSASGSRSMEVNIGNINVQTSSSTLSGITKESAAAGVKESGELLDQLAGGM